MKEKYRQSKSVDYKTVPPSWSIWRQDDNGNVSLVKSSLTKAEALRLVAKYEAKGHKQTYWAEKVSSERS